MSEYSAVSPSRPQGLVDVLDRILDKGLVIAGDVKINLANVELLTIQIRLLVCSIDKAQEIGLDWWRFDPALTAARGSESLAAPEMERRIAELEERLARLQPEKAAKDHD